jgi:hypothetical protein
MLNVLEEVVFKRYIFSGVFLNFVLLNFVWFFFLEEVVFERYIFGILVIPGEKERLVDHKIKIKKFNMT